MNDKAINNITIMMALLAVFFLSLFKISNYDIWWILADGRYIFDNMEIPYVDVFRFVSIDEEYVWYNHLYLTGTIFYVVYLISGYSGLVLFKAAITTATFWVFYSSLKTINRRDILLPLLLLILSAFAVRFRLLLRPDIFSFFFFALVYLLVSRFKSGAPSPLWLLPLIHLAWVNLHGGYFAGIVLLFTVIISEGAKSVLSQRLGWNLAGKIEAKKIKKLSLYSAISAVAVVINPYDIGAYGNFAGFMTTFGDIGSRVETARVGEWQPLSLYHFKGLGICFASEYGVVLALFLLSLLLVVKKADITDVALSIGFFYASTVSIRFIPFAVFVMVPAIYRNYSNVREIYRSKMIFKGLQYIVISLAFAGIVIGVMGLSVPPALKFGTGLPDGKFPERTVSFIKEKKIGGNFFNTYGIGGYLIWQFYPERRVFMDGRVLDNIGDYYEMVDSAEAWEKLELKYDFDVAVLDNSSKDFVHHLFSNPGWALVYWDDRALVFLKRIPRYGDVIAENEYHFVRPTFHDFGYLDHYLGSPDKIKGAMRELDRNISSTDYNSEARLAKAYIYFNMGSRYYDAALDQVKAAVRLAPDLAMAHSALGWLYLQKGMKKEGEKELKKALSLNPYDALAKQTMADLPRQK